MIIPSISLVSLALTSCLLFFQPASHLSLAVVLASSRLTVERARTRVGPFRSLPFLLTLVSQEVLTLSSSTESEGESGTSRKPATGQTSATAVDSDDIQTISSGSEADDFEDKKNMSGSLEECWG